MSATPSQMPDMPPPLPSGRSRSTDPAMTPAHRETAISIDHPLFHGEAAAQPHMAQSHASEAAHASERTNMPRSSRSGVSIVWGLLGCLAVGYLGVVLTKPDLVPRIGVAKTDATLVAEVEHLRGSLEALREEVAEVRSQVSETGAEQRALSDRLAALTTSGTSAASDSGLPPAELRLDTAPVAGPPNGRSTADVLRTAPPPAKKTADAKAAKAAAEKKIETGSVESAAATEPPPFGPAVVKSAENPVGVQIATGSSLDSLRLSWSLLSETHAPNLKNLEPRYSMSVDDSGLVYNLMAGPVKSADEAQKMCKALAAKAVPCKVVNDFGGAAL